MIVSDLRNHPATVEFISLLVRKHPETFLNVPLVYFPSPAEDLPYHKEVESKRSSPFLYVDFLTCSSIFPRHKVFPCPMLAPSSHRYAVNPKHWSELSYEVNQGELQMETYLSFLSHLGSSGGVVINIFGGLKPIAASFMSDFNGFLYMDSSFMHTLPEKIEHIRPLRAVDFADDDDEAEEEGDQQFQPHQHESPLLLVSSLLICNLSSRFLFTVSKVHGHIHVYTL